MSTFCLYTFEDENDLYLWDLYNYMKTIFYE